MYYFAIFLALLSTFVNSSAQLQHDNTHAALEHTAGPCEPRYKDRNANKQLSKSSDYTEELSDAILRELALKKALSIASSADRSKIRIKQQERDSDALTKFKDVPQQTRTESDAKIRDESTNDQRGSSRPSITEKFPEAPEGLQTDKIKEEIVEEPNKIPARQHPVNKSVDSNTNVNNSVVREVENIVDNAANGTEKDKEESNDIGKSSKEVSRSEALIPAARLFEDLEPSENVNFNKNANSNKMSRISEKPRYRSFPNVEPSADVKYNPPPYVKNRINALDNNNENVNTNINNNEISMENEGRINNLQRNRVRDRGNEDGIDGTDSDGTETKLPSKTDASATPSGIESSPKIKDIQEVKISSTSDSLEVVASSTTPSVKFVDSISGNNDSRIKRRRKHRRGKDRGRGNRKKHEKKDQREQRPSTKQRKIHYLPVVSTIESHPTESEVSTVENAQVSTESPSSLRLKAFEAFRHEIMINKNLTNTILKLLINTEDISAIKKQRLKRLLDQLNVDEKRTILYDLEKEVHDKWVKATLDENTTVKRVVISEAEPKLIVGVLARPSQDSQPLDTKDIKIIELLPQKSEIPNTLGTLTSLESLGTLSVNTPRNPKDTEQNMETVSEKAIREKSNKSQEVEESPPKKLTTSEDAKEKVKNDDGVDEKTLTDRLTSDKVASVLDDPKVKAIYEETLDELRKQKSHKESNVNFNTNNNQNLLADQNGGRFNFTRGSLLLDRSMPRPRPELDATKVIEVNLIPSDKDKEFKSRERNHGRYSGVSNEDNDELIKKTADSHWHKTNRNPEIINKRPLSPQMDSDSISQDENLNVNSNLNVNTNNDAVDSDIEFTRRASKRRLPHRSNRNRNRDVNRNVNVNTNVNTIQVPAIKDYYVDGEVWSSRRALDRSISDDGNSNSNSNVNSNVNDNQNIVDRLIHRKGPRRDPRKDEVKMSQETVDSILREVSQLRKQLAEKEAATNKGSNLDRKRLWQNIDGKRSFDQSAKDQVLLEY